MVKHWVKGRDPGRRWRSALNAVGATASGISTLIFALTKFREGAWVVVIKIPPPGRGRARLGSRPAKPRRGRSIVVVPFTEESKLTREALSQALSMGDEVPRRHGGGRGGRGSQEGGRAAVGGVGSRGRAGGRPLAISLSRPAAASLRPQSEARAHQKGGFAHPGHRAQALLAPRSPPPPGSGAVRGLCGRSERAEPRDTDGSRSPHRRRRSPRDSAGHRRVGATPSSLASAPRRGSGADSGRRPALWVSAGPAAPAERATVTTACRVARRLRIR